MSGGSSSAIPSNQHRSLKPPSASRLLPPTPTSVKSTTAAVAAEMTSDRSFKSAVDSVNVATTAASTAGGGGGGGIGAVDGNPTSSGRQKKVAGGQLPVPNRSRSAGGANVGGHPSAMTTTCEMQRHAGPSTTGALAPALHGPTNHHQTSQLLGKNSAVVVDAAAVVRPTVGKRTDSQLSTTTTATRSQLKQPKSRSGGPASGCSGGLALGGCPPTAAAASSGSDAGRRGGDPTASTGVAKESVNYVTLEYEDGGMSAGVQRHHHIPPDAVDGCLDPNRKPPSSEMEKLKELAEHIKVSTGMAICKPALRKFQFGL